MCQRDSAVHSLRAQADKAEYSRAMRKVLENQAHLTIKQAEVVELLSVHTEASDTITSYRITGVKTYTGAIYESKAVILCTGTYLKSTLFVRGKRSHIQGQMGYRQQMN